MAAPCLRPSAIFGLPALGCSDRSCPECSTRHAVLILYEAMMKKEKGSTVVSQRPAPVQRVSQRPAKLPQKTAAEVTGEDSTAPTYEAAGLDETFADLVRTRQKKSAKKAALEIEIKEITSTIGEFLTEAELPGVTVDGEWAPKWSAGRVTEVLDVSLLLQEGVPAATIAKCTRKSQGAAYIRVDRLGKRG